MYITSLEALGISNTDHFLASAQKLAQELKQMSAYPLHQGKHTLTATAEQLMLYPEIFMWGGEEKLLRIIESYLKLPVAYDGFSYYYSVADLREAGPRKWHRDKEDWKMIKICVYINDVNEEGGPFEFVSPEFNTVFTKLLRPKYKVVYHQDLQALLPTNTGRWYKSCTGAMGTVIFADTAHYYHRGKPPTKCDRAAIFFSYYSLRPKNPFFCGRSPFSQKQLNHLAKLLPQHLRNSVTWREKLPSIGKWIPKNRLKV